MRISGIQPFTLLDYPEKTACVVFTAGCDLRCGYCHNPEFVLPEEIKKLKGAFLSEEAVYRFLETRRGLLDGVVVSGGEPTLAGGLDRLLHSIKEKGFLVKLDTNGNRPDVLQQLFEKNLIDYVAMDVKTALPAYRSLVGAGVVPKHIVASMCHIRTSGVAYEFRTTLIQEVHTDTILSEMCSLFDPVDTLYLQPFRHGHVLDIKFHGFHAFSLDEMRRIQSLFRPHLRHVMIRTI